MIGGVIASLGAIFRVLASGVIHHLAAPKACYGFEPFGLGMVQAMIAQGGQQEVLYPVVVPNAVDVMDNFTRLKNPAQMGLHYQAMLSAIAMRIGMWMPMGLNPNIAIPVATPTFPHRMIFACREFSTWHVSSIKGDARYLGGLVEGTSLLGNGHHIKTKPLRGYGFLRQPEYSTS